MLISFCRNGSISDPTSIQLLFEISQNLHDDGDFLNTKDDDNQPARLISRFVHMVNNFKPMLICPQQMLSCDYFVAIHIIGLTYIAALYLLG